MAGTVAIGHQNFETIRKNQYFYIDKTEFIREWWDNGDSVTLITRPRRFGKTLNMSMVEQFFSVSYSDRADLFEGLSVWRDDAYHELQGTFPVIALSFADVKEVSFEETRKKICKLIQILYSQYDFLLEGNVLDNREKADFQKISEDMEDYMASLSLKLLSEYLCRYYGKKSIILLDEYDTPMQEAYVHGYWDELAAFLRNLFNSTFKTNPYLERAIMTGITRVSRESIFSDLNHLEIVTTTSEKYAESFGFTEQEVFAALDGYGLSEWKADVKQWYNGFCFGRVSDMYNPWSIINFLDKKRLDAYWANTSSNSLVGKLIREGNPEIKQAFEKLLKGESLRTMLDEQIIYDQLGEDEHAVWSLLLAAGYLKVAGLKETKAGGMEGEREYELKLTNQEVKLMFRAMIRRWFGKASSDYNGFIKALLDDDLKAMNGYMNRVALRTFSYFDSGRKPSAAEPERFYHGFVLGLLVELADRYVVSSNRESGYGRCDVLLEPLRKEDDGMILEFKVFDPAEERELSETAERALEQIQAADYAAVFRAKGMLPDQVRCYGFAFEGKKVLINKL